MSLRRWRYLPRVALGWLLVGLCACSPILNFVSVAPAPFSLGSQRRLPLYVRHDSLAQTALLLQIARDATIQGGYFAVQDHTAERSPLYWRNHDVTLDPDATADLDSEVALELGLTSYDVTCEPAQKAPPCVPGLTPLLTATFFNRSGVLGTWRSPEPLSADARATPTVLRSEFAALLADITPVELRREVPLSTRDGALKPFVELAVRGQVALARELVRNYAENHPSSAAAWYDLAVLTEALGQARDALTLYDRAIGLEAKPLFFEMRAQCARHLQSPAP